MLQVPKILHTFFTMIDKASTISSLVYEGRFLERLLSRGSKGVKEADPQRL